MKTKKSPKNVEKFNEILNQIDNLVDELRKIDLSNIPTNYYKHRLIDKVNCVGLELCEVGEDLY